MSPDSKTISACAAVAVMACTLAAFVYIAASDLRPENKTIDAPVGFKAKRLHDGSIFYEKLSVIGNSSPGNSPAAFAPVTPGSGVMPLFRE